MRSVVEAPRMYVLVLGLTIIIATEAAAARCRLCGFGAAQSTQAHCVPNAGLVGFNSVPPDTPAYWTVHVQRRSGRTPGRLVGRTSVWSDYTVGTPAVPDMPATCNQPDGTCFGREATFRGRLRGGRLRGLARYPSGGSCTFDLQLDFGFGDPPNTYVCRAASGEVMSEGPLRVQLLRLLRCRR